MTSPPDLTLLQLLLANLLLAVGACLQGMVGYGIATFSAPLLFLISPVFLPAPMTLNATLITFLMLIRERRGLHLREVRYAIGGNVVGTGLGGLTLVWIATTQQFQLLFGLLVILAVGLSVAGFRPALGRTSSLLAGAASGYMGTITAVGGPPIALIYQNESGPLMRANMSAFFLFASCSALAALFLAGKLGWLEWHLFSLTWPGVVVGFVASRSMVKRVPLNALRPMVLTIAAAAGLLALGKGLI